MTGYNELRDGQEFYANGYKKGYEDAKKEYARPQGEWKVDDKIYCSECGESICDFIPNPNDAVALIWENKFCFNCGAEMRKGGAE